MKLIPDLEDELAKTLIGRLLKMTVYYSEDGRYRVMTAECVGTYRVVTIGVYPTLKITPDNQTCFEILGQLIKRNAYVTEFTDPSEDPGERGWLVHI